MSYDGKEEDLDWMTKCIPPDDIYDFALQVFGMAEFFFERWKDSEDVLKIYNQDKIAKVLIDNLISFKIVKEKRTVFKWESSSIEDNP